MGRATIAQASLKLTPSVRSLVQEGVAGLGLYEDGQQSLGGRYRSGGFRFSITAFALSSPQVAGVDILAHQLKVVEELTLMLGQMGDHVQQMLK